MYRAARLLTVLLLVAVATPRPQAQSTAIRGFPSDAVAAQRQREEQFRKVPDSARLKEYMEAMAGEPHVAGQPSSQTRRRVRARRSSSRWGLDAQIEELRGDDAVADRAPASRWSAPTRYTMAIKEPVLAEDPDSNERPDAALQRLFG